MSDDRKRPSGPERTVIAAVSRPWLPRHVKLRHDAARGTWTILAPERVFTPDEIAVAVLQRCDGKRTVEDMAQDLSGIYDAPKERILADIVAMLQELSDKGVVKA